MMKTKDQNSGVWVLLIMVIFTILSTVVMNYFDASLKENHRYTVGVITGFIYPRGKFHVTYQFQIDDKFYDTDWPAGDGDWPREKRDYSLLGKHFIVMFHPDYPWNEKLLLDKEVIATVVAPKNGWDSIPPNILINSTDSVQLIKRK